MIEASPSIPAHIALLLNEKFDFTSAVAARKKLRSMMGELKDQVRSGSPSLLSPNDLSRFRVVMSGGLDLFSGQGVCRGLSCRVNSVSQVARSLVLMADEMVLHDYVSDRIMEMSRPRNMELNELLSDIIVLKYMRPLIEAGLVSFVPSYVPICESCDADFSSRVGDISQGLVQKIKDDVAIHRYEDGGLSVHADLMYDPPLVLHVPSGLHDKTDEDVIYSMVQQCVRSTFWDARDAAYSGAALLSNSRLGLAGLLAEENRGVSLEQVQALEARRLASLPWISGLSIEQTLELRYEAANALPNMREFLARHLNARNSAQSKAVADGEYLAELREQAAQVKSELKVVTSKRAAIARNSMGILSLMICAYGMASDAMSNATGLAQLLTTLGLLHQISLPGQHRAEELKAKPGYVFVAAESILAHAHK